MSRYADFREVAERYASFGKTSGGAEAAKDSFINGAEALVDAAAAIRYAVPFSPTPDLIKDLVIDMAYMRTVVNQDPKSTQVLRDSIKDRLDGIRLGVYILTVSGTPLTQIAEPGAWSTHQDFGSSFGVDDPTLWGVSCNWVQSFQDARC